MNPTEDRAKFRRVKTEQAIQLAMQSKWEDAIAVNRSLVDAFPTDADAYNRLGKALMEIGRYGEARDAYGRSLEIDTSNTIARKNLDRLAGLKEVAGKAATAATADPRLFIEESGKTGLTQLMNLGPADVLAKVTSGEAIELRPSGKTLQAYSARGELLGDVQPKMALRLTALITGGNTYVAVVKSVSESSVEVLIRETYQHPSQSGRVSFPSRGTADGFRPYTRESLLRYDSDEEEESLDDTDDSESDWNESDDNANPDEVGLEFEEDHSDKDDEFDN